MQICALETGDALDAMLGPYGAEMAWLLHSSAEFSMLQRTTSLPEMRTAGRGRGDGRLGHARGCALAFVRRCGQARPTGHDMAAMAAAGTLPPNIAAAKGSDLGCYVIQSSRWLSSPP